MKFISECSLSNIISQLQNKTSTPENLINKLCEKMEKEDLYLHAFLPEKNRKERLINDLEALYEKYPDKDKRPILFGIPIGVKDIFHVDNFETKAGSNLPSESLIGKEAEVVSKLKKYGALIFGKTVTTEFAYFFSGPTCNPHNIEHTPGGSSSGSAAAVAAGFVPLSLGTQTIGSISRPAAFCGIIGFKPSFNRISTKGVIPFSTSADHTGFFTQDLEGSRIIASILCDNWKNLIHDTNKKPVLGIPVGKYLEQASEKIITAFYNIVEKLIQAGFEIKKINALENIEEINFLHREMIATEFTEIHKNWYKYYKNSYSDATKELIEKGKTVQPEIYQNAKVEQEKLRQELAILKTEHKIDLWISPSATSTAPKGLDSTGNPVMNLPWTFSGLPTLAIPFGFSNGLPYGIQFATGFGEDERLFEKVKSLTKVIKMY